MKTALLCLEPSRIKRSPRQNVVVGFGAAVTVALALGFVWMQRLHGSAVDLALGVVTNDFGFPIAEVAISNHSRRTVFYILRTEALRDRWRAVGFEDSEGSLAPGEVIRTRFGHPVPEGQWHVRADWSANPPQKKIYFRVREEVPAIAKWFEPRGTAFTVPIDAWQPPEVRRKAN